MFSGFSMRQVFNKNAAKSDFSTGKRDCCKTFVLQQSLFGMVGVVRFELTASWSRKLTIGNYFI
jgi:hypothetical protein